MAVILMLKVFRQSHGITKRKIRQLLIMMKKASDKRVGGPPTVNISDVFGGVVALGLKSLASVDDEGLSCGGGWRRFMGPWCLLGKVGHSLGVWRARC